MPATRNYYTGILLITASLFLAVCFSYARKAAPDTHVPAELSAELGKWKAADRLDTWLKTATDFIAEHPQEGYRIYSYTDTAVWRKPAADTAESTAWFRYLLCHAYDDLKVRGDVPESKDHYEAAFRFYGTAREYIRKDSAYLAAYLLRPLGNVYTRLGDYKSALLVQQLCRDIWHAAGDQEELASVCGNIAIACLWQDSLKAALQQVTEGLEYAGRGSRQEAHLQSIAAEVYLRDSQLAQAAVCNATAIRLYRSLLKNTEEDQLLIAEGLAAALGTEAELLANADPAAALRYSREILELLQQHFPEGHNREKAISWRRMADIYRGQQDYLAAINSYDAAMSQWIPAWNRNGLFPEATLLFADNTLVDALSGKATCLKAQGRDADALEGMMLAAGLERQLRLHFRSEGSKLEQLVTARDRSEEILELAAGLYRQHGEHRYLLLMLQQAERSKAQLLMEQWVSNTGTADSTGAILDAIAARISYYRQWLVTHDRSDPGYDHFAAKLKEQEYAYALQDEQGFRNNERLAALQDSSGPQRLLDALPDSMVVLEYFAGRRNLYVLSLVKGKVLQLKITGNAAQLRTRTEQYLDTWYYHGAAPMQETPLAFCDSAAVLYPELIPELPWKEYRSCMILPDDYLCRLPFDALQTRTHTASMDPGTWPYFFREINLQQEFSLQLWYEQVHKRQPQQRAGFSAYFVSRFTGGYPELPAVREEYKTLKEYSNGVYLDAAATKSRLRHSLQQYDLVHISTHGILRGSEQNPALIMGDSILYAWELSRYPAVAPLVVLNTCRGADGVLQQGEGVISMARYLTAAGFSGVIASLWSVNDQSGAALLSRFYESLRAQPFPAAALQMSKLKWLEDKAVPASEKVPYYWAGYVYTGVDQPLLLQAPRSRWMSLWLPGSLLLTISAGALWYRRYKKKH